MKPREKIIKKWAANLEGWELVATILWSGIKWQDVFKLSKKVFKIIEDKKEKLKLKDLTEIKWIWDVKAIQIISAFELAKRYYIKETKTIKSAEDILSELSEYRNKKQEYLICITLDWANRLINTHIVSIWTLNQTLIHPREIFALAIEDRANSIILAHNHPSGTANPSQEDIKITKKLDEVSKLIEIKMLDHIIITKDDYFSFKKENIL